MSPAAVHEAAKRAGAPKAGDVSIFASANKADAQEAVAQQNAAPVVGARKSPYPAAEPEGMPVYKAPQVYRVWLAPARDKAGNLLGGEVAYISTEGSWNFGTLKQAGAASLMGPAKPEALGFNPVLQQKPSNTPPKPAEQKAADPRGGAPVIANAASAPPAAVTQRVGDITQPYTRITE